MNIIRYLYLELSSEKAVAAKTFDTRHDAASYALQRLKQTISEELGAAYVIPEDHVDDDGNIWHCAGNIEICSSGYEWSLWKDGDEIARASVEEQMIELSPAEMLSLYGIQMNEFLVEDAERQLRDYAEYAPVSAGCMDFLEEYGFSVDEAVDSSSEHFLLDSIVEQYSDAYDCGIAENDLWYNVIENVLSEHAIAMKTI